MAFRLDLHTHSIVSHDGGITASQYERVLRKKKLDFVAISDHKTLTKGFVGRHFAQQIIPAEEIRTTEGDIIGLYLTETVATGLSLADAIAEVKRQGGLVYVPHPWEKFRKGLQSPALEQHKQDFDIMEVFNARSRDRMYAELARHFAQKNDIAMASSSDAHGIWGLGSAYVEIGEAPTRENLLGLLRRGKLVEKYAPVAAYLYPAFNRFKNRFKKQNG